MLDVRSMCSERAYASSPPRRVDHPLACLLMGMIGERPVLSVTGAKTEDSVMFKATKISCSRTSMKRFPARRSMM